MDKERFLDAVQQCVRCGSCKVNCPTYQNSRNETMSARGRIAILHGILCGKIEPSPGAVQKIVSCIQCGACAGACASGMDIPELIYTGRDLLKKADRDGILRFLTGFALRHPGAVSTVARFTVRPFIPFLEKRALVPEDFRINPDRRKSKLDVQGCRGKVGKIAIFRGCSTRFAFPHLEESLVKVLSTLGYEIHFLSGEVCCGVPLRTLGLVEEAKRFAKRNVAEIERSGTEAVVSLCPTCIMALKKEYPKMINRGVENAMDISSFLVKAGFSGPKQPRGISGFYHDPCHLAYGLNVRSEPRGILERCGISLSREVRQACCGFGGLYSIRFRKESGAIASGRKKEIEDSGAEAVFTACPGCIFQLRKVFKDTKVFHVIEAAEQALAQILL